MRINLKKQDIDKILLGTDEEALKLIRDIIVSRRSIVEKQRIVAKETKERLSKSKRRDNRRKELYQVAEEFRSDLIKKQTKAEKHFKAILKGLNIEYVFQRIFYTTTKFYIVDFYLPKYKTIIEIDGVYHEDKIQKKLDSSRTTILKSSGIKDVIRFKNEDVLKNVLFIEDRLRKLK